jgi:hypothetical protein
MCTASKLEHPSALTRWRSRFGKKRDAAVGTLNAAFRESVKG